MRANDIGYARTSTIDQTAGFEAQLRELEGVKCQKVFREQTSSVSVCPQLEIAMEFMREGDVLVVTKLDRLARSVPDLIRIIQALERKGAGLRVLNLCNNPQLSLIAYQCKNTILQVLWKEISFPPLWSVRRLRTPR